MYKYIYDRLKFASYRGKLMDKNTSKDVFLNLKMKYRLAESVSDSFTNDEKKGSFCFCPDINHIYINYEKFLETHIGLDTYIANLLYLFDYVHELEHVRQDKFVNKTKYEDITDPLLKLEYYLDSCSFEFTALTNKEPDEYTDKDWKIVNELCFDINDNPKDKFKERYSNNHDLLFIERIANIRAIQFVYNFIECNDKTIYEKKKALALYRKVYYLFLLTNTRDYYGDFMNTFGFKHRADEIYSLINEINDTYKLDDETRLTYGLNVKQDTFLEFYELFLSNSSYYVEEDKKLNFWSLRRIKSKTK